MTWILRDLAGRWVLVLQMNTGWTAAPQSAGCCLSAKKFFVARIAVQNSKAATAFGWCSDILLIYVPALSRIEGL